MPEPGTEQKGKSKKKSKKKSKEKAPAVPEPTEEVLALTPTESGVSEVWSLEAAKGIDNLMRVADIFSNSGLVPDRYKNKPNDCAIVIAMALKYGADILGFMQNVYVVHGTPGMESKLAIALVNMSGVFEGPIHYTMSGSKGTQDRECIAWGVDAKSGEKCEMSCSIGDANRAGWTKPVKLKTGGTMPSKWTTMPEMMLRYRAAMNMIRVYHPEILFGMKTVAELEDIGPREVAAEILPPHHDEIKAAVSSATASRTPRLTSPVADEKPLSESISESSTPVAGAQQGVVRQQPKSEGNMSSGPAPDVKRDGQMSLGAVTGPADLPSQEEIPDYTPPEKKPPADPRFAVLDVPENQQMTDAESRKDRVDTVTLYSDLCRKAGQERMDISTTTTMTFKNECRRLIKEMDLL